MRLILHLNDKALAARRRSSACRRRIRDMRVYLVRTIYARGKGHRSRARKLASIFELKPHHLRRAGIEPVGFARMKKFKKAAPQAKTPIDEMKSKKVTADKVPWWRRPRRSARLSDAA